MAKSLRSCSWNHNVSQTTKLFSASPSFPNVAGIKAIDAISFTYHWAYRPSVLLLQLHAPSSVLFLRFSVSELGTTKSEIKGLVATIKTSSSCEEGDPTQTLQHPPEKALPPCPHGWEGNTGTLISLFTFLLLRFDVLLWCCFDFLDPGSTAKCNPYGHTTGRKFHSISDPSPNNFAYFFLTHWFPEASQITLVRGLQWWSLGFNLMPHFHGGPNTWKWSCCFIKGCWVTWKTDQGWGRSLWDSPPWTILPYSCKTEVQEMWLDSTARAAAQTEHTQRKLVIQMRAKWGHFLTKETKPFSWTQRAPHQLTGNTAYSHHQPV